MCDDCARYRQMAEEWRERLAVQQAPIAQAFEAGYRASGLSLTVYRARMEAEMAAFLAVQPPASRRL